MRLAKVRKLKFEEELKINEGNKDNYDLDEDK